MATANKKPKAGKRQSLAGFEGARVATVDIRVTGKRKDKRTIRARPGTFEWVYGRRTADIALYHAGSHFARLWEAAGTADARSPDYEGVSGGGSFNAISDKRCEALSELNEAVRKLGEPLTQRLTHYCVYGKTAAEIAKMFGVGDRELALVLKQDLRDCAIHFRFLSVHGISKHPQAS
ncbi:DUF6456 domain-containing protein [Brucella gallinifaecis]|uniref:DUF6456 domain-containing protein n=1 Tax=Brucella gallinifaecis TaxID=215590 RepID=UPI0023612F0D|nr:DUF6456 domain-containing protein [Brucella gallinifaecis]